MTAKTIAWLLATRYSSPFRARRHLAVVPNVSWGMLPWEADLLICAKSGYLTEVEIKISMADWKADFEKAKHRTTWGPSWPAVQSIKRFWYASPVRLAIRHHELALPPGAGVIAVDEHQIAILKPAVSRSPVRRLSDADQIKMLRLAALKAWGMAYKPIEGVADAST